MKLQRQKSNGIASNSSGFGPDTLTVEPSVVRVGDMTCATFVVTGYPREVRAGWLDPLLSYGGAIDVSVHVDPMDMGIAADRLRKQLARLESSRRIDASHGRLLDVGIDIAAHDAQQMAERLARGDVRLFRVGVAITVRANDDATLAAGVADVRSILSSLLADLRPTTFRALEGWTTTLPLGVDRVGMRRTFDTPAMAATFPFPAAELSEPNGVLYGRNLHGSGLVFWDRFGQDNHNSVILARSGSGKSYLSKLEVLRSLYDGVEVFVVDPEDEYRRLAAAVDGVHVALGNDGVRINPFDLGSEPDALTHRALFVHSLIATLLGREPDAETKATLDGAIVAAYTAKGITADARTHRRQTPILADLAAELSKSDKGKALTSQLAPFVSGTHKGLFDGPTTQQSSSHLTVYSLRDLADEIKPAATMMVLDRVWQQVSNPDNRKRRMVTVDEAWLLMRDPAGAKFLYRLAKSARKYWCGLSVITQDAGDLLGSDLGKAVVANAATQILLRQAPQSIEALAGAFRLSDGEKQFLLSAERGAGIVSAGSQRIAFSALASEEEHKLCTSDPAELLAFGDA